MNKVREPYFNAAETNEHRPTFYIEHTVLFNNRKLLEFTLQSYYQNTSNSEFLNTLLTIPGLLISFLL